MRRRGQIDYAILIPVFLLTVFGLVMLASASSDLGKAKFDDAYYYLRHQIIYGLSIGLVGFFAGLLLPYRNYKKFATILLFITIIGLILIFTPLGSSSGTGAERWLSVGPITFQPSEILKLTFVMYLAAWLSRPRGNRGNNFREGFVPFLVVCGVVSILLILERSTSSVIIIMLSALVVYFAGGAKKSYILYTVLLGLLALSLLIVFTPYRLDRVKTYFNPSHDTEDSSYQLNKALMTIGSGGVWGVGYGKSIAKVYLPERIGDSIFAIIGEEFGFLGSTVLVTAFFFVVLRAYQLAKRTGDRFGRLLLVGFGTIMGIQVFIHIGSNSGLIPLTGVPLPFISYGGTALAVFLTMTGVMLNISKHG